MSDRVCCSCCQQAGLCVKSFSTQVVPSECVLFSGYYLRLFVLFSTTSMDGFQNLGRETTGISGDHLHQRGLTFWAQFCKGWIMLSNTQIPIQRRHVKKRFWGIHQIEFQAVNSIIHPWNNHGKESIVQYSSAPGSTFQ